jgi:hypothetical protein
MEKTKVKRKVAKIDPMNEEIKTTMGLQPRLVTDEAPYIASTDDPIAELRKVVKQHRAMTRSSVSIAGMSRDKKNLKTGGIIRCQLPLDVQAELQQTAKLVKTKASKLESVMIKELRKIPIYTQFLNKVYGVGPVVAAYLVTEIDIRRSIKSSALRRFCGLAVINGRLERRTKGVKLGYSAELRTRLFQMFSAMFRNGKGKGSTSKYLDVWMNAKHRKLQMAIDGKIDNGVRQVSANGYAHSYGWHKAADIFIEDLYTVWRAMEGLEVWPSYYAAKLGYEHGGKISVNAPKFIGLQEALEMVGDVSGRPFIWPSNEKVEELDDMEEEELDEVAVAAAE